MPRIFGILSQQNSSLHRRFENTQTDKRFHGVRSIKYANDVYGANITLGFYEMESSQEQISISSNSQAVICGRLFRKSDGSVVSVCDLDIDAINESSGKELSDNYWGRYICIIINKEGITFYRDPQGLAVLYYKEMEGGYIFATDLATIFDFLELELSFNWSYLISFIISNHNLTSTTPFDDVFEVLPGCATTIALAKKPFTKQFWNPTHIKSAFITNEEEFQEHIYTTTRMVLNSWIQGSKKIAIEVSGGLDSSSLLALLRTTDYKNPIQGVNYFNSLFVAANEKEYAQDVGNLYNVPIRYIDSQEALPFSEIKLSTRYDRPSTMLLDRSFARSIVAVLGVNKEDELLSGQGGDHLFLAPPPLEAFLDFVLEKGFLQSLSVLQELCAYYRMPYPKLLRYSMKHYVYHKIGKLDQSTLVNDPTDWMTENCRNAINPSIFQPFFWDDLKKVPPGKAQQILAILSATLYIERGHNIPGKPVIYPLLSQPLIELALSMPTYQTFKEGYNRFHYRKAMSRHLQGKFIWRRSKGETSGPLMAGARKHYNELRELLLDGTLVRRKYVDRDLLEKSLLEFRSGVTTNSWPIINLFVVEKWLHSWQR